MMRLLQKQPLLQLVEQLSSLSSRSAASRLQSCTVCQRQYYSEGHSHQQPRDGAYARQRQSERGQQQQRSPYKHRSNQTDQQHKQQQQLRSIQQEPHPSQVAYEQVVQGPQQEIARQRALGKRLKALGDSGHAREARQALRIARDKADLPMNVILYNVTIAAIAKKGMWKDALELLKEMKDDGLQPDKFSYSSAMTACSRGGNWYVCTP
jgi:pentatricopeptide repeat protein